MIKKEIIIFLLLFFFKLIIADQVTKDNCKFYDAKYDQTYDLSPLIISTTPNNYYNATFPKNLTLNTEIYFAIFNFCEVPISYCSTTTNSTACQLTASGKILELGNAIYGVNMTASESGIKLSQRSQIVPSSEGCSNATDPSKRWLYMEMTCTPEIDFQIKGPNYESPKCQYTINIQTKYACKKCKFDCSNHGQCNQNTTVCTCNSLTDGNYCEISKLSITSASPLFESGGITNITGYFGTDSSQQFNVYIGDEKCISYKYIDQSTIQCEIGSGTGYHNVTINDNNGLSAVAPNIFHYDKLVKNCPNGCSNHGQCDTSTGLCGCDTDYINFDCSIKNSTSLPPSNPNINDTTGGSSISNENLNFQINIISLVEYSINGTIVNEFSLTNITNINPTILKNTTDILSIKFTQLIKKVNCTVEYIIDQVKNNVQTYDFAGLTFSVQPGSLKLKVSILNYQFENILNTLQLRIKSSLDYLNDNSGDNSCNSESFNINSNQFLSDNQNLNYLVISKDSKIFVSRFLNRLLSDGKITSTLTSIINSNNSSVVIGLNMPHCNECLIDPDFSLLVSPSYKDSCSKNRKWFLPVVITVPIVGFAAIVIVLSILYKKNRIHFKVIKDKIKLKNLNTNS